MQIDTGSSGTKTGVSAAKDPATAVAELHAQIQQPETALAVVFCSPDYDTDALGPALSKAFGDTPVIGCTTAGEIGPDGCAEGSLVGFTLGSADFDVVITTLEELGQFEVAEGERRAASLAAELVQRTGPIDPAATFGFLLIDGLSNAEERVVSALYQGLGGLPLIGGSAADGVRFGRTAVLSDGKFREDTAVFCVIRTSLPFVTFKTDQFMDTDEMMVVTEADCDNRIVTEINGMPAAEEYARIIGLDVDQLEPQSFAKHPVLVSVAGKHFARSIGELRPDGSLKFQCAIDRGIVISTAVSGDFVANLEACFADLRKRVGEPSFVIGCDCLHRRIETQQTATFARVSDILKQNRVVGFTTYGEQYNAMHINQTLTGIAFGQRPNVSA